MTDMPTEPAPDTDPQPGVNDPDPDGAGSDEPLTPL
jgi:hypothetical protein